MDFQIEGNELLVLYSLEQKVIAGLNLSGAEVQILFDCLWYDSKNSDAAHVIAKAATMLTEMDLPIILRILDYFPSYRISVKELLLPLLACIDYNEIYIFLLHQLKDEKNRAIYGAIITVLSRTDYPLLPLIILELNTAEGIYLNQLKSILLGMGMRKLELPLSMCPIIPHEKIFRELFGDETIRRIYI